MLDSGRKQELIDELRDDLDSYISKHQIVQEFIDSTCQDCEEIDFVRSLEWWVSVVGDDNDGL